jgi:tyrosyl-DNA phosphodiesterase 2
MNSKIKYILNNNFKVISYNIWFDNFKLDQRLYSLIENIKAHMPDIVCMQEVLPNKYDMLKTELFQMLPYSYPSSISTRYGCAIFSKHPFTASKTIMLPSNMSRHVIITRVDVNNLPIVIVNTHFESIFEQHNQLKLDQFKIVSKIMEDIQANGRNVILCSDTNVVDNENFHFNNTFGKFTDSWIHNGENFNDEFTYDHKTNTNLQQRSIKISSRLDRILFSKNIQLQLKPNGFSLITGLIGHIQPSDHHGVCATFEIKSIGNKKI